MSEQTVPLSGPGRPVAPPGQYLGFALGGEEYAVGILRVREIIEYTAVTRIPSAPPSVRGVINLRGGVVPVVDLAVKFGQAPCTVTRRTCIVVVEVSLDGERLTLGVLADSVSQVMELSAADIEPPPAFGTSVHVDYLLGMGKTPRGFVLILDVERVLTTGELVGADATARQAEQAEQAEPTSA